jgi:hypothetical protein
VDSHESRLGEGYDRKPPPRARRRIDWE